MTLSEAGAALVNAWFNGEPVGLTPAHRELAERLVEADIATATATAATTTTTAVSATAAGDERASVAMDVAVVVPVRNDVRGLEATLGSLRIDPEGQLARSGAEIPRRIVVVDDGSDSPLDPSIGQSTHAPLTIIRGSESVGPGNARNLGASRVDESVIVFVDAGVIVSAEQLAALAAELAVGETLAAAPRVRSEPGSGRLADYERSWSPLDLGPEPGLVGPGRRIAYVPSTCIAVRTSAFTELGGFDPDLRYGEDVDLIWRLVSRGWIRYVPDIVVTHPPRENLIGFLSQRFRYGTAAGPLARRHGRAVAPARLDSRSAVVWAALLAGWYRPAIVAAAWSTARYAAMLSRRGIPRRSAVRFVWSGWAAMTRGLAVSVVRTWWPVAVLAATRPRFRLAPALLAVGWLRRLRWRRLWRPSETDRTAARRATDIGTELALGIADDSAYALGVWRGSIGARTAQPLLPHIVDHTADREPLLGDEQVEKLTVVENDGTPIDG